MKRYEETPVAVECRISNPNSIPPYNRLASTGKCITSSSATTKERPHEILEHITLSTTSSLRDEEDILGDLFQYLLSAHQPTSTAKTIYGLTSKTSF
jgi:hypothetical protein